MSTVLKTSIMYHRTKGCLSAFLWAVSKRNMACISSLVSESAKMSLEMGELPLEAEIKNVYPHISDNHTRILFRITVTCLSFSNNIWRQNIWTLHLLIPPTTATSAIKCRGPERAALICCRRYSLSVAVERRCFTTASCRVGLPHWKHTLFCKKWLDANIIIWKWPCPVRFTVNLNQPTRLQ